MKTLDKKHSVGKTIATLRRGRGWTQVELAEKLQISDKAVSKWETDDAFPSIEFFPVLAELFDVSIDYLMTGKAPKKEIVTISRVELCAKYDDVTMLNNIQPDLKDENGKTVVDYAKSYKSKNIIDYIIRQYGFKHIVQEKIVRLSGYVQQEKFLEALYFAVWTNTLETLALELELENSFKSNGLGANESIFRIMLTSLDEKSLESNTAHALFELLVTDDEALNSAFDVLFAKHWKDVRISGSGSIGYKYCKVIWDVGLSYLIECAIKNGNYSLFERCYTFIQELNQKSINAIEEVKKDKNANHGDYYGNTPLMTAVRKNPLIAIRTTTIEWLIANNQVELAEKLNLFNVEFNLPSVDPDIIRVAKLKFAHNVDEDEIAIQSAIHKGILSIDEIISTKRLDLVRNAIQAYPIHFVEILIEWYNNAQWRAMFEYAVDNNIEYATGSYRSELARHIIELDKKKIEEYIIRYWNGGASKECINKSNMYFYENGIKIEVLAKRGYNSEVKKIDDISVQIKKCKKRVLDDLAFQLDKESTIDGLTEDYFYAQLDIGNTDIVIIKLCVRLEAILKNDYRYEGDFSEMLKRYCDQKLHWSEDDDCGYYVDKSDSKTIKLLNSLRIQRNNIVHSEKTPCELTVEDIRYCIEYICKMG